MSSWLSSSVLAIEPSLLPSCTSLGLAFLSSFFGDDNNNDDDFFFWVCSSMILALDFSL